MKSNRVLRLKRSLAKILRGSLLAVSIAFRIWGTPIVGFVALGAIWRYSESRSGFAVLAIAVSFVCAIVTLLSVRRLEQRCRIIGLAVAYLFIAASFGAVYQYVFIRDPYAFSFSGSIEEGKAINEFSKQFDDLLELNERIYYLGVAEANMSACIAAANNYSTDSWKRNWRSLDESVKVSFYIMAVMFAPTTAYMEIAEGSKKYTYGSAGFGSAASLLGPLLGEENATTFHRKFAEVVRYYVKLRSEKLSEVQALVSAQPQWGLLDFIYFSVVTVTTLGYGDIVPNTRLVRVIVLAQAVLGVLYLAFALSWGRSKLDFKGGTACISG